MISTLDRFYTPDSLASILTEALSFRSIDSCADPTCGHGQLLLSAEAQWPNARYLGLDIDRHAVQKVRRRRPQWTLSVGDLMSPSSLSRTRIVRHQRTCDLLMINPPFSMGASKGVYQPGSSQRCSVAMAHILAAIELFEPTIGVGAIVPESLLYSELDEASRRELSNKWIFEQILSVPQSTFKGTRAHSTIVTLRPKNGEPLNPSFSPMPKRLDISVSLVRGGLPVYKAEFLGRGGIAFVHTTDLLALASGAKKTKAVNPIDHGRIAGSVVLLPRVGVPSIEQISPLKFTEPVQLSDCVIAIQFKSYNSAKTAAKAIWSEFDSLLALYKGTGARYVTIRRLAKWLCELGIRTQI